MALPAQIQAALDAADATLSAANAELTGGAPAVADAAFAEQAQAEPAPEVAPVAPPEPPKEDLWEKKYRVLQGKYDAEVPQLHHKVRDLETNLRAAIERMTAASEAKERQPEQPKAADPKDVENFGSDLVEMVSRVSGAAVGHAAQVFDARLATLEGQIKQLSQALQGATQQVAMTAEQTFFDRVTKAVPNWQEVNVDQGFLAWLAEKDPVYGLTRQAALQNAQEQLDADRAAAVFLAYLGPQKPTNKGPDPLDKQTSPKGAATVPPTPTDKPVLTSAQITAFYDDVRKGLYRGREQEFARIELIINTALSEGRVR